MIILPPGFEDYGAVWQGVYGTCFTWFVTALGAAIVMLVPEGLAEATEGKFLDASLGFAGGVMLAASYWSLLAPSIEMAEEAGYGDLSFLPAAIGFLAGAFFVFLADFVLPESADDPEAYLREAAVLQAKKTDDAIGYEPATSSNANTETSASATNVRHRKKDNIKASSSVEPEENLSANNLEHEVRLLAQQKSKSWRRLLLLVIAVTIHNFPEGLAVGVGFGGVGVTKSATLEAAEVLTLGIGIQNFPEGLAVSLPMRRLGYSKWWCFFYGQLSGMVEPIGGFLGAAGVQYAQPALPYALAFAAGAMVYVVVDSIVPEAQTRGNSKMATWGAMVGFLVMMTLDVALG
ncbi:Zinc transporter ZIP11 [Hondaea fermentalgiana]|uniref:Zinc transporter ZIP11 n=1 Tax=Hondaea fermentalgiana TaxID=2315210 RepID=A0A2R5GQL8_9STRA|nr:Zinc transporter ZIP11 [Hondaea fermentalgiana]|eukprot:GBG30651.1 Zinc transporter ZIP11 [Hondaea fermentalgiana]